MPEIHVPDINIGEIVKRIPLEGIVLAVEAQAKAAIKKAVLENIDGVVDGLFDRLNTAIRIGEATQANQPGAEQ